MDKRRFVCDAMDYADKNFGSRLVLQELASISGYSVPQFTRLFTEYTGITPMRYVNITRIINAELMLRESNESITNIAFDCGFESLEVFERSFKRYFSMSASDFRKSEKPSPRSSFYLSEKIYYERLRRNMVIDGGNSFNWGKTAEMYGKSRNIYPDEFWNELHMLGVGANGQKILDIGTGTGILPQNMCRYGGEYTGVDLSPEMVDAARKSSKGNISFLCADAHNLPFGDGSFDIITALQCWVYFDKSKLLPELRRVLKDSGSLYIMFMTWLPEEDEIIKRSFDIVKRYNPNWSAFMKRADQLDFNNIKGLFSIETIVKRDYKIPFSRETWCDRMIASRGVGATLPEEKVTEFRKELAEMLCRETDENFTTLHEAVIIKLKKE